MSLYLRSHISVFLFIFLLYVNPLSVSGDVCKQGNNYLIRNRQSGLTLDASGPVILVQHVNGKPAQHWSFHCGSKPGFFIIENKETGDVLDALEIYPQKLITDARDGSLYQEWSINNDGSITNAATNMCLDVFWGNFTEGNWVQAHQGNGSPAQQFVLQRIRDTANVL